MSLVISFHKFATFNYYFGDSVPFACCLGCISISIWTPSVEECYELAADEIDRLTQLNLIR